MTIKGLWKYYVDKVGYGEIEASELKGKLVAVDILGTVYSTRAVAKKIYLRTINPICDRVDEEAIDKIWLSRSVDHLFTLLAQGFIPIYVYDGPHPELKKNTLNNRSKIVNNAKEEIIAILTKYEKVDIMKVPAKDIERMRALLERVDRVPNESKKKFFDIHRNLGIPWVKCKGEGERTCALLNHWGIVAAVKSSDSDCLPCGAKLILLDPISVYDTNGFGSPGFATARLDLLLNKLGMEMDLFQDLCIMSGTDFNDNIPNKSWGRSLELLLKYKSISIIGKKEGLDISCLNHREVRKMFEIIPWEDTVEDYSLNLSFDEKAATAVLNKYDLMNKMPTLLNHINKLQK